MMISYERISLDKDGRDFSSFQLWNLEFNNKL